MTASSFITKKNEDIYVDYQKDLFNNFDACSRAKPQKSKRRTKPFNTPSQNEYQLLPMNDAEIESYQKAIHEAVNQTANACCDTNDEVCKQEIQKIKINWCKHNNNSNTADPCINQGANFQYDDEAVDDEYIESLDTLPKKIIGGSITLSLLKFKDSNLANDDYRIILHELGHACSLIKMQLNAQKGSIYALNMMKEKFVENDNDSCLLSNEKKAFYIKEFAKQNMSDETISCFLQISEVANKNRFKKGNCPKGCKSSVIDELLADSVAINSIQNNISEFLAYKCRGYKDYDHPLGIDRVGCFLQTPSVTQKFKEQAKCIK